MISSEIFNQNTPNHQKSGAKYAHHKSQKQTFQEWTQNCSIKPKNWDKVLYFNSGTVASVVIQAIGSGTNEETLMKATHLMIR